MMQAFLIADDSPPKMVMLRAMLKIAQWNGPILLADTTEKAKELIDANDIGFAWIDYYMPSERGIAIIRYLKEKNPSARIALVSSSDKQSNFDEAKAAGAEACICTSYRSDEVERALLDLLEAWKAA